MHVRILKWLLEIYYELDIFNIVHNIVKINIYLSKFNVYICIAQFLVTYSFV